MSIVIKLKNYLEDTQVSVLLTKPDAVKCVFGGIFISAILFRFSAENPRSLVLVAIYI